MILYLHGLYHPAADTHDYTKKSVRKEGKTMTVKLLETIIKALVILELLAKLILALITL